MKLRGYLDTSAYLGVLLGEESAKSLKKEMNRWTMCSSSLLVLESERSLVRMSREKMISIRVYEKAIQQLREDIDQLILRDFTLDLCLSGTFPAVQTPRSLDLIHLRTAKWFVSNGGLEHFFTLDQRQANAARDLGFSVWSKK